MEPANPQRPAAPPPDGPIRLATPPLVVEHTHWSPGLLGFYASCAGVALGATIAAAGWWFFRSTPSVWVGSVMIVVCSVTTYRTLSAARRPKA